MKNLFDFYKTIFISLVTLVLIGHWLYQVIWAWERFWQGILVFVLLVLASYPWDRLEGYFSNDLTLKGKFFKDNSNIYKFSWFLCVISGYFAITILMIMYWFDTTNEASYDSRYWIFIQLTNWLDIPYEGPHGFRYWIFTACIYFLFLLPTFRGAKELTPQVIDWLEYKAEERKKQEEIHRKAKEAERKAKKEKEEAKLKAEKEREAKIEAERLALIEAEQAEIKRKREEEEAKKRAEQEKLQREIDAKKAKAKEMLESLKAEPLNKINKLTKKKEDLELLIDKEKNIINELSKKYSFLRKIVPDRFD